jgi:hypothetical protein
LQIPTDIDAGHNISNIAAQLVLQMTNRLHAAHGRSSRKTAIVLVQELFRRGFQQIVDQRVSFAGLMSALRQARARAMRLSFTGA